MRPQQRLLVSLSAAVASLALTVASPQADPAGSPSRQPHFANPPRVTAPTTAGQPSPAFVLARKLEREFAQQQADATGINPYSGQVDASGARAPQPSPAYTRARELVSR